MNAPMMKNLTALCSLFVLQAVTLCAHQANTRFVNDFGAIPNDGKDDTEALRAAAAYCRENPGTTLILAPGDYLLRDEKAIQLENLVMSGAYGQNPESKMFVPYHEYVRGLDFTGCKGTTIEAAGAKLICDGWMEPISIEETSDFTLNGLTVDYLRKPMSEGVVTGIGKDDFVVYFDKPAAPFTSQTPFPRAILWDNEVDGVYPHAFYFARQEVISTNLVRFKGELPAKLMGARVSVPHSFHFRPAIFIHQSQNTLLSHVTIHAQCGMGIVGFHTKDVSMDHLTIAPAPGYHFSTNTDATHFASCEGTISFDHCFFYGQGDDATNVHGYYHDITAAEGNLVTLELKAPTFTHCQLADLPRVGDKMALVRTSTLEPVKQFTVKEVIHQDKAVPFQIRIDGKLPENPGEYYMINATLMPGLVFRNCIDYGHIARSVLAKTSNVIIENNIFRGVSMAPITICSEPGWREGWHCENAVVRNNRFEHCNTTSYCHGASIGVRLEAPENESIQLHRNILIEGNTFEGMGENECAISVENAHNVTVRNNHATGYKTLLQKRAASVKE